MADETVPGWEPPGAVLESGWHPWHQTAAAALDGEDECSLYAQLLARRLRALDENTRDLAMLEIDNLVFQLKLQKQANLLEHPAHFLQQAAALASQLGGHLAAQHQPQSPEQSTQEPLVRITSPSDGE